MRDLKVDFYRFNMVLTEKEIDIILEYKEKILNITKSIIEKRKRKAIEVEKDLLELTECLSILSSFSDNRGKQLISILTGMIQMASSNLNNSLGKGSLLFICHIVNEINFDPYKKKFVWEGIKAKIKGFEIDSGTKWS